MNRTFRIIWLLLTAPICFQCATDPSGNGAPDGGDGDADTDIDADADADIDTDVLPTGPEVELPPITGTHYYVDSVSGNDGASGLSPEEAWQSTANIGGVFGGEGTVKSGDAVHFLRGTTIDVESISVPSGVTFTTYGDGARPVFTGSASVRGNAVMEGLAFKGTPGGTSGISVSGSGNIVYDCEVDGSNGVFQLGFIVMGEGNQIIGNFVHDLSGMTGDSGDMNSSGGAEAYMVMASNNEIAYNSAVNCWGPNQTLGGAEGGCLEIVNGAALSTIENVRFHHNYCERSVGLFEGCSGNFRGTDAIQENHGIIANSYVAYNLSVDAMWLYLLQPINTDFRNLVFEHNTIVHTPVNAEIPQQGASSFGLLVNEEATYRRSCDDSTPCPQGLYCMNNLCKGALLPGDITVRNNFFVVIDDAGNSMFSPPPAEDLYNNLFSPSAPMGLPDALTAANPGLTADWRLVAGSPAIDVGSLVSLQSWVDFDGNTVPCGSAPDVGAFEYCEK